LNGAVNGKNPNKVSRHARILIFSFETQTFFATLANSRRTASLAHNPTRDFSPKTARDKTSPALSPFRYIVPVVSCHSARMPTAT
jgi:hypothetical protein